VRGFREQFEQETADQIEELAERLLTLNYPTGPSRYYGLDLAMCLKAGALAGSMIIASALIEIYVRGLVISYTEKAQANWSHKVEVEKELESKQNLSFGILLDHLVEADLFSAKDSDRAKTIYKTIRIPTHHGLPARLLAIETDDTFLSFMDIFGLKSTVTMSEFERFVEYEALPVVKNIVEIIERNQFNFDNYA